MNLKLLAKVVHDNLNAGGGSERLAVATIKTLNELGFMVDVQTRIMPNIKNLRKCFGSLDINIRQLRQLDIISVLESKRANVLDHVGEDNDSNYDLIINTHGDLLPYLNRCYENEPIGLDSSFNHYNLPQNKSKKETLIIT
ncbi:MAG TPA: hypothetical protein VE619_05220, partial [Nitrososphaeraceae archaeon]|nr:hypothetical protein [Nitrososphaeraceae archaeon]